VRRAAREVLSRAEFQQPSRTIYQRVTDWIFERVGQAISALVSGGRGSLIAWVIVIALLAGIGYVIYRAVQGRGVVLRDGTAEPVSIDTGHPPERWDAEAAELEEKGDWRGALRCRYRSLIAALARAGVIDEVPGRTSGEYRADLRASLPAASSTFGPATDLFERAWYGNKPTGPEQVASFRELASSVRSGAGSR
jgi:hypothetical protein